MHISLPKKALAHAVSRCEKITGKKLSLAVLKTVYLEATKDTLLLRATNLDLGIEIQIPARVESPGAIAVSGDTLSSLLGRTLDGGDVTLKENDGHLEIVMGTSEAHINIYPHEDFPTLPRVSEGKTVTVKTDHLISGFKSVWYAAATSSMKPELASVFLHGEDNQLIYAATDSFRLAEKRITLKEDIDIGTLLIPVKNVNEILRNLDAMGDTVDLEIGENQIACKGNDTYITSRVVDGVFPDYGQIIPSEFVTEATILKEDLSSALKVASLFANKFNQVVFKIMPQLKQCILETRNPDVGESSQSVDAALSGEDIEIGFNQKYIIDGFQSLSADSVSLRLTGAGKPLVIQNVGDLSFTYLVMPMNR